MFVPSVITSFSPAAPSTSTRLPGQPSQRPSERTACPNMRRDRGHIRYKGLFIPITVITYFKWSTTLQYIMEKLKVNTDGLGLRDFIDYRHEHLLNQTLGDRRRINVKEICWNGQTTMCRCWKWHISQAWMDVLCVCGVTTSDSAVFSVLSGAMWELWQRTRSWVCEWRTSQRPVSLLNIQ